MGGKSSKEQKPSIPQSQPSNPQTPTAPKKQPAKVEIIVQQQQKAEEPKQNMKQVLKEAQSENQPKEGIKEMAERIGGGILSSACYLADQTKTFSSKIKSQTEATNQQYIVPLKNCYNKVPEQMTDFKFQIIRNYSFNERFLAVNLLALSTALLTFRKLHNVELLSNSLRALRNTGFIYLGGGLFISPQMYNPVMKNN